MNCYQSLTPYNLKFSIAGNASNIPFPQMSRQATFRYGVPIAIVGVSLASSILKDSVNGAICVGLIFNQSDDTITIGQDTQFLAHHIAVLNSNVAGSAYYPANQVSEIMFPDDAGIYIPANAPVSLYTSTDNTATTQISAIATFYTLPAK